MKRYTYDDLADLLDTNKESLYTLASRYPDLLEPVSADGGIYLFDEATAQKVKAWWDEHSRFRVSASPPTEEAYTVDELASEFDLKFTTIQYYRRRYDMLYPDYYAPNPAGRGRPVAMYRRSTIEEWKKWVDDGRQEPHYARVKNVQLNQGIYDAMVYFADGTVAGLRKDEWRLSPPADDDATTALYIKFAARRVEQKRYGSKWKKAEE